MDNPPIKDHLESDFFTTKPGDVKTRLDQCLASDSRNIRPGKREPKTTDGQAVSAIQDSLRQIRSQLLSQLPDITDAAGDYGVTTRKSVSAYKAHHRIVRSGQPLDDIVGRMTLTQLDDDMLKVEGKGRKVQPPIIKTQDVYIRISGFDRPSQQGLNQSSSPAARAFAESINKQKTYQEHHSPLETIWFVGGQKPNPTPRIVALVQELIASQERIGPLGRVMISGGSAGGKNVLEVALELSRRIAPIIYMAVWDGAFQREDLLNPSTFDNADNFNPEKPATLKFKGSPVFCAKDNFFQSWGHTLDKTQEIHGELDGFNNIDLTNHPNVLKVKRDFDSNIVKTGRDKQNALEEAHKQAFFIGRTRAEDRVRQLLLTRPLILGR